MAISLQCNFRKPIPESKVYGANMGPNWGRQDPGGPHVGPMNIAIWDFYQLYVPSMHLYAITVTS